MKKALVTGISGFFGAVLSRRLIRDGWEVHGIVRQGSDQWRLKEIENKIKLHFGDMLHRESIDAALKAAAPDAVFHLSAYGAYPGKQSEPEKIIQTNVNGSLNLFSACRDAHVAIVVNAGSSSEYGSKLAEMREDMILEPNSYYAVAKAAQTLLGQHMSRTGELSVVTLRLFSVYGPFEEKGRFVPTVIERALRNAEVKLAGKGIARDYIYADDAADAFISAASTIDPSCRNEIINVGTGVMHTLEDVFEAVKKSSGSTSEVVIGGVEKRAFDTNMWVADTEKMSRLLNVRPRSLAEGIDSMVKWFPEYSRFYE